MSIFMCYYVLHLLNSLAPRRFEINFREVIFKLILVIDGLGISCEIVLTWTPQDLADDKSTLVQVMAWCRQATSHYLSQCWPSSLSPYGVTRLQWVKLTQSSRDFLVHIVCKFCMSFFPDFWMPTTYHPIHVIDIHFPTTQSANAIQLFD